jgi:hypothetical protein
MNDKWNHIIYGVFLCLSIQLLILKAWETYKEIKAERLNRR